MGRYRDHSRTGVCVMLIVTCTAAPGVYLISYQDTQRIVATVKAEREVAEAMCVAASNALALLQKG